MIDRDHLAQQTGHDTDLQREVLRLFCEQMRDLCRLLAQDRSAFRTADGSDLAASFHRYRGAALAVGAGELAAALAEAEAGTMTPDAGEEDLAATIGRATEAARDLIAALPPAGLAKEGETN